MKAKINIEYFSGVVAEYTASTPEFVRWERKTGLKVTKLEENIGLDDLLFLAYNAMRRENPSQPVKPYEAWCDTVDAISSDKADSPKVTPPAA